MKYHSLLLVFVVLAPSCKKDKDSPVPAPTEEVSAADAALPEDAVIQSLTLESGRYSVGYDTYTFAPAELMLKGAWLRKNTNDEAVKAEDEIEINELEWMLVEQNIRNLKLQKIDPSKCGGDADGDEKVLSVTYLSQGASETLEIPTVSSSAYTCGDYAMPDETFDLILKALQDKLPAPLDLSQYKPI